MNKDTITDRQGTSLIIMFLVGTTTLSIFGTDADEDFWIAIILSVILALIISLIFIRLNHLFPNKTLFDIIEICFGKFIGKGIIILFTYFLLEEGIFVLINFGAFVNETTLTETPEIIIKIGMIILCSMIIKKGLTIMGRWAEYFLIIFVLSIISSLFLSIPNMEFKELLPFFNSDVKSILKGVFSTYTFPFGEIIAFTVVFSSFKKNNSCKKIYIRGLLIGGILILATSITNILVLGLNIAKSYYHPSYRTYTRVNIRDFIQRIEVLLTIIYVPGALIKIGTYFLASCKGVVKLIDAKDYKFIVIPVGLLMITLSHIYFDSIQHFWEFNNEIWPYYALLFEIIFPIILIIIAEIRVKSIKSSS